MDSGNTIICLYSGRAKHLAKVFAESYAQIPLPMNEGAHELLVKACMNIERKMKRIADLVASHPEISVSFGGNAVRIKRTGLAPFYGESLTVVETFDKAIALISCAWLLRLITTTERSKAIRSLEGMTHQTIRRALKRLVRNQ